MQHVLPDKAVPQTYKTGIPTIIIGVDPRTGAAVHRPLGRGLRRLVQRGEGHGRLGRAERRRSATSGRRPPRSTRALYPHVQWSRDYRTDSGGPGQWRGLCGSHYEKEVRVDAKVYTYVVGMKYPMPGICGGKPGAPNELIIRYGSDDPYVVEHTADWVPIEAGDSASCTTTAAAAAGATRSTATRRPCSTTCSTSTCRVEGAARDYGVVLTGSLDDLTLAIDDGGDRAAPRRAARATRALSMGYRVGVDVGGTFTDLICVTPDGEVVLDKTPTTLDDQSTGVMNGLGQLAERFGLVARRVLRRSSTSSCTAPPPPTTR